MFNMRMLITNPFSPSTRRGPPVAEKVSKEKSLSRRGFSVDVFDGLSAPGHHCSAFSLWYTIMLVSLIYALTTAIEIPQFIPIKRRAIKMNQAEGAKL